MSARRRDQSPEHGLGANDDDKPSEGRSFSRRLLHLLFWTALFYGLTVLVARLAEWASTP